HMNLGAGRVVLQDLLMIGKALDDGEVAGNPSLVNHIETLKRTGGTSHVLGLMSPGGVHAHQDHIAALVKVLGDAGVPVVIHALTDGRDTPPQAAKEYVTNFLRDIAGVENARIGTVDGRYYAMDRDKRWERVERAYDAIALASGKHAEDPLSAIQASYDADVGDEFIEPTVIGDYDGIKPGDGILMANFRADRAREILLALLDPAFDGFDRDMLDIADACGMVEYSDQINQWVSAIFPPKTLPAVLGKVVSDAGLTQLRIAETEKYPHVTFFFNGGEEKPWPGEDRILVASPKVATYDLQPEMSAPEVTDKLVDAVDSGKYDLVIINFANPDMVGHTGSLPAAIKAVETVDTCLGRLVEAIERQGGAMLVTADHGNCETMRNPKTGGPHTAHTLNKVPIVLVNGPEGKVLHDGKLADVAPTLLQLLQLEQPAVMTGESLIDQPSDRRAAE
ncbi:MAG: 2,3-bisphosphoglycerate-independent phosphoglycerate mutase, partial [Pseudomonadota bacterium]